MTDVERDEVVKCFNSSAYFIHTYIQIHDAERGEWIPFHLWKEQYQTLKILEAQRLTVILKARQLGMTWLCLAYALWKMRFRPAAKVLLFSKGDREVMYLLGSERMKGMHARLPDFLKTKTVLVDNDHTWIWANESSARGFPTTGGDSYTGSLAIVDEGDKGPDLATLMRSVKPTIDGGGQMILLSASEKSTPQSTFKNIYRSAKAGTSPWFPVFLPWFVRPDRNEKWYAEQVAHFLALDGSLDGLHEQYPATDTEALAPSTLDKRIAAAWLEQCKDDSVKPIAADALPEGAPSIPGLVIYRLPDALSEYVMGADPAEGNPTSDESALTVLDHESGEEVAVLAGRLEPSTFASHIDAVGKFFNHAAVMVERNNHGHAVLLWLRENSKLTRLKGHDGKFGSDANANDKVPKDGWLSNARGKSILYDTAADAFREGDTVIHSFATWTQLSLIEGSTLRAPEGEHDDRADSYALALVARDDRFNPAARLAREAKRLREKMEREKAKQTT